MTRPMKARTRLFQRPFFIRLAHWEFWPFHLVYGPIYLYWVWLCIRCRSFFFFNAANPSIQNGGFLMESKKDIYDLMPPEYYGATILCKAGSSPEQVSARLQQNKLHFPLIAKPDIGMQGKAVQKLEDASALKRYVLSSRVDFLIQEFISYENEVGIFYYRYPSEPRGHISGIVKKEFPAVYGDGVSTIETLLLQEKRYILQLCALRKTHGPLLKSIPARGEKCLLTPYGNHARGAKFIDVSHLVDDQLTDTIDAVCGRIDGFYFGRLDIRYADWDQLRRGVNFSIIEVNGAGSEPTHIYDPAHSIFFAWREIIRHWNILWEISRQNHLQKKAAYLQFQQGIRLFYENKEYVKLISDGYEERA